MQSESQIVPFRATAKALSSLVDLINSASWAKSKRDGLSYLLGLCEAEDEFLLLVSVLSRLEYVDGASLEAHLQNISRRVCLEWKLGADDTCIVVKDIEGKTDSSAALQQMIKPHFSLFPGWTSNKNFRSNLRNIIADLSVRNIVLVDDFSGSGKGLSKLVSWVAEKCKQMEREPVALYACFVGLMRATRTRTYHPPLAGMHYCVDATKAITDFYGSDASVMITKMLKIENRYGKVPKSYSLGFDKSEAAFAVQNLNLPNNAFPILWYQSAQSAYSPLFLRLGK